VKLKRGQRKRRQIEEHLNDKLRDLRENVHSKALLLMNNITSHHFYL